MIFPIRCSTCNKYIGAKGKEYKYLVQKYRSTSKYKTEVLLTASTSKKNIEELKSEEGMTPECKAMNKLGISRYCCRTRFLASMDLLEL